MRNDSIIFRIKKKKNEILIIVVKNDGVYVVSMEKCYDNIVQKQKRIHSKESTSRLVHSQICSVLYFTARPEQGRGITDYKFVNNEYTMRHVFI